MIELVIFGMILLCLLSLVQVYRYNAELGSAWSQFAANLVAALVVGLFIVSVGAGIDHSQRAQSDRLARQQALQLTALTQQNLSGLVLSGQTLDHFLMLNRNAPRLAANDAKLMGSTWTGSDVDGGTFLDADLTHADMRNSHAARTIFDGSVLNSAALQGAIWDDASLTGAQIRGAKLQDICLHGADLGRSDLTGSDLTSANLSDVSLVDADLRGADLRGADLRGASLLGANLVGAQFAGAIYSSLTSWPEHDVPAGAALKQDVAASCP